MSADGVSAEQRIDADLLSLLDSVSQYQSVRAHSSDALKQAFFDISRAKRSQGYRWISPDQYSNRAQALATATIDPTTGDYSLVRREPEKPVVKKQEKDEKDDARDAGDPLLWFGVLVPPALRDAQRGFEGVLEDFVRLAQLKSQLASSLEALSRDMRRQREQQSDKSPSQ
ncbi:hypothetical protein GGI07_001342 [Coemansia sp. Benny D115]|nr:hypothetical protein GGI07_001342 [Coemansia sp. Benny D115]